MEGYIRFDRFIDLETPSSNFSPFTKGRKRPKADFLDNLLRYHCPSEAVNFNLDSLICIRSTKVARDQIELSVACCKLMLCAAIALM